MKKGNSEAAVRTRTRHTRREGRIRSALWASEAGLASNEGMEQPLRERTKYSNGLEGALTVQQLGKNEGLLHVVSAKGARTAAAGGWSSQRPVSGWCRLGRNPPSEADYQQDELT
eukprot:6200840-Pleurochrysis_carterae.AAC.3